MSDALVRRDGSFGQLATIIEALELSELQKTFLRCRWLDQVHWLDHAAQRAQRWHYTLRVIAVVGAVIVPALISVNTDAVRGLASGLSLLVAISVALEGLFRFGERWRHYRRTAELLKSEGWMFFQRGAAYREFQTHADAYPLFAAQVETMSRQEVDLYMSDIAREAGRGRDAGNDA